LTLDLAILNGTLIDEHGEHAVDLGVQDGKVALVAARGGLPPATDLLDARGLWVLPGIVDAHFHCRAPDHPEREDFASGTMAAAAGGVTTLLEMPVADVGVTSAALLKARQVWLERDAYIDVGLFAACGTLDREAIHELAEAGAIGFKVFTHAAPAGREQAFKGLSLTTTHELMQALSLVRETGLPCAFHAEDDDLLRHYGALAQAQGLQGVEAYHATRPPAIEGLAVACLALLAEATNTRTHIVHVTSAWAADLIRAARQRGAPITAETCPQYLLLDEAVSYQHGTWAKIAPPLRPKSDVAALWAALADGTIDFVASDHAPFTATDREAVPYERAPSGMPNVEAAAPLMLSAALEGRAPFPQMVRWLTANPARTYGLYPRKGALQPGSDADIVLYDPQVTTTIDTSAWFSRSRRSAKVFEGMTYRGRVVRTISRGQTVFHCGQIVGKQGYGKLVRPRQ
jgi:allantoinase